jgi:hypothetical protein
MWQVVELDGNAPPAADGPSGPSTHRLGIKLALLAAGIALLAGMEIGYSLALRKYSLEGNATPFLNGPITAVCADLQRIVSAPLPGRPHR